MHAIATRGGWDAEGSFVPMPLVSTAAAESLFRHKVITLLRDEELLTEDRIDPAEPSTAMPPVSVVIARWTRVIAVLARRGLEPEQSV